MTKKQVKQIRAAIVLSAAVEGTLSKAPVGKDAQTPSGVAEKDADKRPSRS